MGKKKQFKNGFFFFMLEKKPQVEKRLGRIVTMAELADLLCTQWKDLPEAGKQKYKVMKEKGGKEEKLDCRGVPLAELARQEEEKKKKVENMTQEIINTIDVYHSSHALQRATFYIMSTSYYVCTEEYYYSPAELSLVQFSFERGIIKEHHVILKPKIPKGYGYSAQQHSEATHNLLQENNCGVEDKEKVFQGLKDFVIEEGNRLPPIYTLKDEMVHTEAIIDYIAGVDYFRIYSLDKLFQHLYSTTFPEHPVPQSMAKEMLTHCGLDYHPNLACEWHINYQEDAGKYCSLSCARRWIFMMCDNMNLVDTFGVEPCEDKHLPRALQSCGVDVRHCTFKEEYNDRTRKSKEKFFGARTDRDEDDDRNTYFSFSHPSRKKEAVTSTPLEPAQSSWSRKVAGLATGTSHSRACSGTSLNISAEDFPALGAGAARKGPGFNFSGSQHTTPDQIESGLKPDADQCCGLHGVVHGQNFQWSK